MSVETIRSLFSILQAAGIRPPDVYQTPHGLKSGITVFDMTLEELTRPEVESAACAYVKGPVPFWPTPGQLLALVPGLDESHESWRKIEMGGAPSILEVAILDRVGERVDPTTYRQSYRIVKARWLATPRDRRRALDDRGESLLRLSDEILQVIPKLLAAPIEPGE